MIEKGTAPFKILDFLADSIIPLLAIILLVLLVRATLQKEIDWRRWAGLALGIATVYILKTIDKRLGIWPGFGSDYSTHTALFTAVVVPLIYLRSKWMPALVGVFVAYAALMIMLGFHTIVDIVSTLVAVLPLVFLANYLLNRKKALQQ